MKQKFIVIKKIWAGLRPHSADFMSFVWNKIFYGEEKFKQGFARTQRL